MKFADFLSKEQIRKFNQLRYNIKNEKANNSIEEETFIPIKPESDYSRREIEELMGTRRDRFIRVRGAVRRK